MVATVMPFRLVVSGISDVGCVREKNEDTWDQLADENFFVLADGMGGHRAGDVASKEAVRALLRIVKKKLNSESGDGLTLQQMARVLRVAIEEVNRIIYELGKTEEGWRGMGTTLCCLHIQPEGVVYAHVGDSRIYRLRKGTLEQLTDDHSLLREMISLGQIQDQPRAQFAYKNIITKAIGTEPVVEPSVNVADVQNGDIFALCSDGLTDVLSEEEIQSELERSSSLRQAAERLVAAVKAKGAPDNVTLILIKAQEVHGAPNLSR